MIKTLQVLFYLPVHVFDMVLAHTPRAVFIAGYKPSSDAVRESETIARNNARYLKYYLTK